MTCTRRGAYPGRCRSERGCQQPQHGATPGEARNPRSERKRGRGSARAPGAQQTLEHRILLTATLCLLAFGAVMVYSASSATTLLQGQGNGSGYLVKYVVYGAIGLVLMRVLARDGLASVQSLIAPLLVVVVRAGARRAPAACGRQRQRRAALDRPGPAAVPAVGADEARARAVLPRRCSPSARSACTTCASCATRCWWSSAAPACWSSPSPTSARRW